MASRAVAVSALICLHGCEKSTAIELPRELLGVWTSSAPKYSDRFFELRDDGTVSFGLGGDQVKRALITGIELVRDKDFHIYHISHLNETGDVYRFSVRWHPARAGQLNFLNQPLIVWTKKDTPATGVLER